MASPSIINGDYTFNGTLAARRLIVNTDAITSDSQIASTANISASKVQQEIRKTHPMGNHATAAAALRQVIHCAVKSGTITSFGVGATVAPTGGDSVTVTLKKNGVAVLSASVVLDVGNANFDVEDGTISDATLAADDVLEAEITAVSGTTGKGVFVRLVVTEGSSGTP